MARKDPERADGRKKGSRHGGGRRSASPLRRLEEALADALRDAYEEACGHAGGRQVEVPIELRAVLRSGKRWQVAADPPLAEQVRRAAEEAGARELVFQPGQVYCFRCETSLCTHSAPPSPGRVFGGYSPTGVPQWPELTEILIASRHPRVDAVYNPDVRVLAAVFNDAEALTCRQLAVFGRRSKTYDILAQIAFGFLRFPSPEGGRDQEKVAMTLQAVEVRCRSRRPRIVLNVLGRLSGGGEALESLEGVYHMRVLDSIVAARRLLGRIAAAGKAPPPAKARAEAEKILKRTARALERIGRQSERRTGHAERRRVDRRPTAKALEDALAAQEDRLLWDEHRRTVVVIGSRGRVHVFSPGGRHITSLVLKKEEVEGRKRRERWQTLDRERRRAFKETMESLQTRAQAG